MKQRERDFLPGKLYLLRVHTNHLLTFDQQLLEHLFQVLQEKEIIFKSADKARPSHISVSMYYVRRINLLIVSIKTRGHSNPEPLQDALLLPTGAGMKENESVPFLHLHFRLFITSKASRFY